MRPHPRRRPVAALALALAALALALAPACGRGTEGPAADQHRLEQRLLAPCCWRENLADHASPSADELRAEIGQRLAAGETADAIETDIVGRYGERIRALPAGGDPRWMIGAAIALAMTAALAGLFVFVRRRRRSVATSATTAAAPAAGAVPADEADADRDRLDDELLAYD